MDVRVHNIVSVTEDISHHTNPNFSFVTRTLNITDKDGNEFSLTMFSDKYDNLHTTKIKENCYA